MTAALFLLQNVNLTVELGVRVNGARLSQNLTALNLVLLDTAEQSTDVVACFSVVEQLAEHLDTGYNGLARSVHQTNDLNFLAHLQLATLYTAGSYGTTTGDGEYVLDRHDERLVSSAVRGRDIRVNSVHQLHNLVAPWAHWILKSLQSRTLDDRCIITWELVLI